MKPKEIYEKLGIDANKIKLYKREGIFKPDNPPVGNRSTEYTEADLEKLKRIVVLNKAGITCSDIKKIQNDECDLAEVLVSRKKNIEAEIERKKNALVVLEELLKEKADFKTFETDYYLEYITTKEAEGEEFMNIEDMYDYEPVSLTRNICCPTCGEEHEVDLEEYIYDQSSYEESENGMGPDIVYSFNTYEEVECSKCGEVIIIKGWIREYPAGAYDSEDINIDVLGEEKRLLKRLATGELDGIVGDYLQKSGGSTSWMEIKDGVPIHYKQGPGGKIFNGRENERYNGVLHILQEWETDEQKLAFLRKFGWLMKDVAVKDYSAKYKPKK